MLKAQPTSFQILGGISLMHSEQAQIWDFHKLFILTLFLCRYSSSQTLLAALATRSRPSWTALLALLGDSAWSLDPSVSTGRCQVVWIGWDSRKFLWLKNYYNYFKFFFFLICMKIRVFWKKNKTLAEIYKNLCPMDIINFTEVSVT